MSLVGVVAVKENQPSLAEALRVFFDEGETSGYGRLSVSRRETVEKESWTHRNTAGVVDYQPLLNGRAASGTLAEAIGRRHA